MANADDLWARAGDVGRLGLIAAAIGMPLRRREQDRAFDAVSVILACSAISKVTKAFWDEPRPNGENRKSFPSQHAAECFAAAVSLRRGNLRRTPAIAAAAAVAATRIFARKHHLPDVIAGAAIGIAAGSLKRRA